jgi:valyl-tRNA synthetase
MSKSKGNVINPLHVAETYGTDAVRMALVVGNTPGQDIVISEDKIRGYRNFATKIWNAARFVLMAYEPELEKIKPAFTKTDQKRLKELKTVQQKITKEIESFKFHKAGYIIYHYFWHTFADKIIEESKERLRSENLEERATAQKLNLEVLKTCLKFLHPFMPFITEEIWGKLPEKNKNLLLVEPWQ